jgi:asparagine synthase (glutamine-hydrolysing)
VILIFAGEEFPDPRVVGTGHERNGRRAFYLVSSGHQHIPGALNGRFHGLLIDRARGISTLFNDRYGMQRLYYHEHFDGFYFAAEAKAILAVRPEQRTADQRSIGELVSCGVVLENRTIFRNIHLLPIASAWTFRDARLDRKDSYFQPAEWADQERLAPGAYYGSAESTGIPTMCALGGRLLARADSLTR